MESEESGTECENCGAPLSAPDAVCARCEPEIEAFAAKLRGEKPQTCPVCHENVPKFESILWPRDARWYQSQRVRLRCPECHSFVRVKPFTKLENILMWLIWPVAFGPILLRQALLHDVHLDPLGMTLAWVFLLNAIPAARPIDDAYEADLDQRDKSGQNP